MPSWQNGVISSTEIHLNEDTNASQINLLVIIDTFKILFEPHTQNFIVKFLLQPLTSAATTKRDRQKKNGKNPKMFRSISKWGVGLVYTDQS